MCLSIKCSSAAVTCMCRQGGALGAVTLHLYIAQLLLLHMHADRRLNCCITISGPRHVMEQSPGATLLLSYLLKRCMTAGSIQDVKWRDVRVGHILKVEDEELFPADLLCLFSALEDQACFIKTTNLDGESNLKIRQARFLVQRNTHVLWCNFLAPSFDYRRWDRQATRKADLHGLATSAIDCLDVHYKADPDI